MDDILDDNFKEKDPIEKFEAPEEDEVEFVPHIHIESRNLDAVALLLEQYDIPYEVQRGSNFDSTGIIPLTGNQLDSVIMTVFVPKDAVGTVDQIMADYQAEKEEELAKLAKADSDYEIKNIAFIVGCLLFLAYVLWKEYRKMM